MVIKTTITAAVIFSAGCIVPSYADEVTDLISLLNSERTAKGRKMLKTSAVLNQVAQMHASDMVAKNYFSHTGKDGSTLGKRAKRQGYNFCYVAENIASGQRNAAETMASWRASSGHNKNNLSRKPTEVGAGFAGEAMWVLVFGKPC